MWTSRTGRSTCASAAAGRPRSCCTIRRAPRSCIFRTSPGSVAGSRSTPWTRPATATRRRCRRPAAHHSGFRGRARGHAARARPHAAGRLRLPHQLEDRARARHAPAGAARRRSCWTVCRCPPRRLPEEFIARYMLPFQRDGGRPPPRDAVEQDPRLPPLLPVVPARGGATRLDMALPDDAALHAYALDTLMAGTAWSSAYAAAMRYPAREALAAVRVTRSPSPAAPTTSCSGSSRPARTPAARRTARAARPGA
jgi:hypothetical protein